MKKKICRKLLPIFLQNILYKTLFVTNFVGNTCEFYNFVGNNYPRRNYLPIKILGKSSRKKPFLAIFLTNLQENSHVILEFVVVKVIFPHILLWYQSYNKTNLRFCCLSSWQKQATTKALEVP